MYTMCAALCVCEPPLLRASRRLPVLLYMHCGSLCRALRTFTLHAMPYLNMSSSLSPVPFPFRSPHSVFPGREGMLKFAWNRKHCRAASNRQRCQGGCSPTCIIKSQLILIYPPSPSPFSFPFKDVGTNAGYNPPPSLLPPPHLSRSSTLPGTLVHAVRPLVHTHCCGECWLALFSVYVLFVFTVQVTHTHSLSHTHTHTHTHTHAHTHTCTCTCTHTCLCPNSPIP